MSPLKSPVSLETTFGSYVISEILGEGGAGRVYGGKAADGSNVAVKVLSVERATTDRKGRFKNEIAFLMRAKHPNVVGVIDHGIANSGVVKGPFYVMRRYDTNLRSMMREKIAKENVLPLFAKILDGVEAAHLQNAVHRDLKPENILFDRKAGSPAIADFGVASFTDDIVATAVETAPTQRLANFLYAAPEQRVPGLPVGKQADIYALGLMLNEMFTSHVPHGTDFGLIGKVHSDFGYLDPVVAKMIKQVPAERYSSIEQVKAAIASYHAEFLSLQKISQIDATVIPAGDIDEPLAHSAPQVVSADWNNGALALTLDRPVNQAWVDALRNIGSYTSVMGIPPTSFHFQGKTATVHVQSNDVQRAIDFFKEWLPSASQVLKARLQAEARDREYKFREELKRKRAAEEERLRVNRSLRI